MLEGVKHRVPVELSVSLLVKLFAVLHMFFCLGKFPDQPELSVELPHSHAFIELCKRDSLLDLTHIFVLIDPLVRQVLAGLWAFYQSVRRLLFWRKSLRYTLDLRGHFGLFLDFSAIVLMGGLLLTHLDMVKHACSQLVFAILAVIIKTEVHF